MLKDFKEFALRGNVVDMGIGIVVGAAFTGIVNSFVSDLLMPPIGLLIRQVDFTNMYLLLLEGNLPGPYDSLADAQKVGAITLNYGLFTTRLINFLITAWIVFLLVRTINKIKKRLEAEQPAAAAATVTPTPPPRTCPYCFSAVALQATRCPHCTSHIPALSTPQPDQT